MKERPLLLWVDLTEGEHEPALPGGAEERCTIHVIYDYGQINAVIDALDPDVLCFEYHYPSDAGLTALARTKRDYPKIPIIMVTVYHSEALAVWALRTRVWDYLVKPFSTEDLLRSAVSLFRVCRAQEKASSSREVILPLHDFAYMRNHLKGGEKIIVKAQSYILQHLSENVQLSDVARYCYISHTHLSRLFREIGGTTFKEFVLQTRIRRAVELLAVPDITVTSICYDVGFRDASHFGRVFKRYVGMCPSAYRKTLLDNKRNAPQFLRLAAALAG
jgi:YesN/AraC family two-component response regulator